ncbi:DUF554 domain-containing protein [Breznakiella homolactica]|uniref:DUF554 domain-containing protein n=1 Tax=Breznakiella homolactica TaxID=2798577 RepID=A0A7T7XLW6_9SPIR|nr:DUF554 domain-containing protein [Breznakiella homolactica]QQO08725.1 DUF554 domain-containing protein [Breznakiella homolactica]
MLPIGVWIDNACVLIGGLIGASCRDRIPQRIKEPLTVIFGVAAIGIGITSFIRLHSLPAVLLALISGALIGELLNLDLRIKNVLSRLIRHLKFPIEGDHDSYMQFYLLVAVTLCASGANIFGALNEGMTGDSTVLISKAVMDIFAAAIFASRLGYAMILIVIPQCLILTSLFYLANFIMPVVSATMILDFISVGGLLTFVVGISIAGIKHISAANLLPALILVFPVSALFTLLMG